jgi:protein-tyrosine-phosphatase
MAEAFLREYAGQYFEVYSAGLEPKPINPYTTWAREALAIGF